MIVAVVACVSGKASGLRYWESEWYSGKTMPPETETVDAPDRDNFARGENKLCPFTVISDNCVIGTSAHHWRFNIPINIFLGNDDENVDYTIVEEMKLVESSLNHASVFKVVWKDDHHRVPFSKWIELYDGDDEDGKETLLSSYGPIRLLDDETGDDYAFSGGGEHHWGKNVIEIDGQGNLLMIFDPAGDPDYIEYEACIRSHDSGTAKLIKDNNQWKLADIASSTLKGMGDHVDWIYDCIEEAAEIQNLTTRYFYDTIQEAINAASTGDVIELPQRTYTENIDFLGKAITLQSRDPNNPEVAAATIIEGTGTGDTVTFSAESQAGATLIGITITCSDASGIYCSSATPTISNCIIRNCSNDGVYCNGANPVIRDCTINGCGNGIRSLRSSSPMISNCLIYDNLKRGVWCIRSAATIKNNWIHSNTTGIKLALEDTSEIKNNTIVNNTYYGIEKGIGVSSPTIANCILWGNGDDLFADFGASYTWFTGDGDPLFVDPNGVDNVLGNDDDDYHLASDSPCINAGDPDYLPAVGEKDIDGRRRVSGNRIDIGAYEDESACFPSDHPDYDEWILVGKPACWCYPNQCYGDVDNQMESDTNGSYYVGYNDLAVLAAAWRVKEPPKGPGIDSITYNGIKGICADYAHNQEGKVRKRFYRVGASDINILAANWKTKEPPDGPGLPADCLNVD
jgi:parallel beta-helix repeat protein